MKAPTLFDNDPGGRYECPTCGERVEVLVPTPYVPRCCNKHAGRLMVATSEAPRRTSSTRRAA